MTISLSPASPFPATYLSPECRVGRDHPDWEGGCPSCPAPGFQDPVLGWQDRPCACQHHTAAAAS